MHIIYKVGRHSMHVCDAHNFILLVLRSANRILNMFDYIISFVGVCMQPFSLANHFLGMYHYFLQRYILSVYWKQSCDASGRDCPKEMKRAYTNAHYCFLANMYKPSWKINQVIFSNEI